MSECKWFYVQNWYLWGGWVWSILKSANVVTQKMYPGWRRICWAFVSQHPWNIWEALLTGALGYQSMGLPSILFRDACKLSCSIRFPIYLFASLLAAFQELGLDCANWTEPVYADLLRCYSSHLLRLNCEGWWWTKWMGQMDKGCEWFTCCLLCCLVCHRQAGGIEEAMLTTFFDRVCSPVSIFPLCRLDEFWVVLFIGFKKSVRVEM